MLRLPALIGVPAAAAVLGLVAMSAAAATTGCRPVSGHYTERDASGPDCTSPVGLCIAGDYAGDLRGTFTGRATAITPSADTAETGVLGFVSDSTITARLQGRKGTLLIKNAGVFRTAGAGSIVDLQTIVGGTGDFTGATGDLRAEGTFNQATGGRSRYTGQVCLP